MASFTLDTTAPAASTLAEHTTTVLTAGGWNASETTSTIRATLSSTAGATKPVAGDSIELLLGGIAFSTAKTVQLSDANITAGYVDFTVLKTDLGSDGAKVLSAKVTDVAGNVGAASTGLSVVVDKTDPTAAATPVVYTNVNATNANNFEATDIIKLVFSEVLASISGVIINDAGSASAHTHTLGTVTTGNVGAVVLDSPASTASFALGTSPTLVANDTITLTGVDLAGNSASMTFTMAQV